MLSVLSMDSTWGSFLAQVAHRSLERKATSSRHHEASTASGFCGHFKPHWMALSTLVNRHGLATHKIVTAGKHGPSMGVGYDGALGTAAPHARQGCTSRPISLGSSQWVQDINRWHAARGRPRDGFDASCNGTFSRCCTTHTCISKLVSRTCDIWPTVQHVLRMLRVLQPFAQSALRPRTWSTILAAYGNGVVSCNSPVYEV